MCALFFFVDQKEKKKKKNDEEFDGLEAAFENCKLE